MMRRRSDGARTLFFSTESRIVVGVGSSSSSSSNSSIV